ncbi:hypothetical protein M9X92_011953 [Pyricularia oryzae]|nr:hypothetical protein M9X92_011953 [Pyricularia oryzae]
MASGMTRPSAGGKSDSGGFWSKKMARKYRWEFYVPNVISGLSGAIVNSAFRVQYSELVLKGTDMELSRHGSTTSRMHHYKMQRDSCAPPHHLPGLSGITGDIGAV